MKKIWWLFFLAIFIPVAVFVARFYSISSEPKKVKVVEVKRENLKLTVTATHQVVAKNKVELNSLLSGKVSEIKVKVGDKVKKDDVLIVFDKKELEYQLKQAQGAYEVALAQRDKAKKAYDSKQATQEDLKIAEGQLTQAKAALDLAKLNLERATLKSPIDGIVSEVKVKQGVGVMQGAPLITIIDPNSYIIQAEVDESDIQKVKIGQDVEVKIDAYPDRSFSGKVKQIGLNFKVTETGSKVYPVEIEVSGIDPNNLREGMSGEVSITAEAIEKALVVPTDAVSENGVAYVFVVDEKNRVVKKKKVTIGVATEDYVEIKGGLKEGDLVVIEGTEELRDGERVAW